VLYEYTCEKCGEVTRNCPLAERNNQVCDCGRPLERIFPPRGLSIKVPESFRLNWSDILPTDEAEAKTWENTSPKSSTASVGGNEMLKKATEAITRVSAR
jgi:hypothetical protein